MYDQLYTTESSVKHLAPRFQHYFRVLLSFSAAAALLGSLINGTDGDIITLVIAAIVLIYSFIAYWINKAFSDNDEKVTCYLTIADGIVITLAISEFNYNPWPSLLLASLLQFTALSRGGVKQWLYVIVGTVIGFLIGFFILKNQTIDTVSSTSINLAVSIGGFCYLCLYGFYSHQYSHMLEEQNAQLVDESQDHKLRNYRLSRYLPKPVWESIDGKKTLKTERKRLTVFFSDIVGFTELSEELEAETLSEVLNSYLTEMSKVVNRYNGSVDKFMGDAIMVVFGDDESKTKGTKKDAIECVSMAIAMSKRMHELQPLWAEMGVKKPLQIRIGINSGYCTVGTFGTSKNLDYTALGVHVNLASRLETAGQPGEILVSHETWALINDVILCRDKGHIKAKGFTHPIQVYVVVDHRKDLGSNKSYIAESTEGFSMLLDMQKVKNYDKDKVLASLDMAAKKLRERFIR